MAEPRPVVYLETNFLVAAVFPVDNWHVDAIALLAEAGYELRIPALSVLEARSTVRRKHQESTHELSQLKELLISLSQSGKLRASHASLADLYDDLDAYARRPFADDLQRVLRGRLHVVPMIEATLKRVQELALDLPEFGRRDGIDLHILATVMVDAASLPATTPRIFVSTNRDEFRSPGKLPGGFYDSSRLIYQSHFHIPAGIAEWRTREW